MMEIVWSCMISEPASLLSFPAPESVMPDAKADSSVNMVIMRSMSAKWSNERHVRHFIMTVQGNGCHVIYHWVYSTCFNMTISFVYNYRPLADNEIASAYEWLNCICTQSDHGFSTLCTSLTSSLTSVSTTWSVQNSSKYQKLVQQGQKDHCIWFQPQLF